ncbi:MAG: hypothetical protein IT379_04880 [Deltaproteobacteria bacterium]|nr:hypothetical protein [Deltaproteobacteria bacterium]
MTASDEHESWLPNLVGGVSIWKLAPDLNEEQFFDGRLLVPDTEGSDSLPVRVTWDLTGLVPLADARRDHPERVQKAVDEFLVCLARTAAVFEKGGSGYDKYKQAFTVPALDADGGAHYFFDPKRARLCVINWGASPRKIRHAKEYLFGYQDFGLLIAKEEEAARAAGRTSGVRAGTGEGAAAAAVAGAAAADAAQATTAAASDAGAAKTDEQKKREEEEKKKKEEEEKRKQKQKSLWWVWLLVLLGVAALIALLVLWQRCNAPATLDRDGGVDASAEEGGVDAGEQPIYGRSTDDAGPSASDMGHRDGEVLGVDAGATDADVMDASSLDGEVDASATDGDVVDASDEDDDDDAATRGDGGRRRDAGRSRDAGRRGGSGGGGSGGGGSGGGGSGGGGSGGGGGGGPPIGEDGQPIYGESRDPEGDVIYWIPGPEGAAISLPHREHYHPDAVQWRIVGGTSRVYDYSGTGPTFHVYLRPGETFDGVRVQWRDGAGGWHDH